MKKKKNIVISTIKWVMTLMKNKIVAAVMMLVQGIMFAAFPGDDMTGLIRIAAFVVILASAVNVALHLFSKEKSVLTVVLVVINCIFVAIGILFFVSPYIIERYVRYVIGVVTVIGGITDIVEMIKVERKRDWKFAVSISASVFLIGLGVVLIIAESSTVIAMQRGIGGVLILNAAIDIWYIMRMYITKNKS